MANFGKNFPNIQRLILEIRDIQSPHAWTQEVLERDISENFKESSYVHIKTRCDPWIDVTKYPYRKPETRRISNKMIKMMQLLRGEM